MASFLRLCHRCTATVRFMSLYDVPDLVTCDSCVADLKANEESARQAERQAPPNKIVGKWRGEKVSWQDAKKGVAKKK